MRCRIYSSTRIQESPRDPQNPLHIIFSETYKHVFGAKTQKQPFVHIYLSFRHLDPLNRKQVLMLSKILFIYIIIIEFYWHVAYVYFRVCVCVCVCIMCSRVFTRVCFHTRAWGLLRSCACRGMQECIRASACDARAIERDRQRDRFRDSDGLLHLVHRPIYKHKEWGHTCSLHSNTFISTQMT